MSLPTDDKARKALPIFTYLTEYFPDATLAEVGVSVAGNEQHNPGQPLHWARGKSTDQLNTAFRHLWDHKTRHQKRHRRPISFGESYLAPYRRRGIAIADRIRQCRYFARTRLLTAKSQ